MKNKTLGWWTLGLLIAYFFFFFGDENAPIVGMAAFGFFGAAIWCAIRLINLKDIDTEAK
jgi:hypothetical protein